MLALLAFFEQCLDSGNPIWSSVFGFPFLHHGYYGFIGLFIAWLILVIPYRKFWENLEA